MRCNNCGWNNAAELVRCEKCNYPLDGSLNIRNEKDLNYKEGEDDGSKTVKGRVPNAPAWDQKDQSHTDSKRSGKEGAEVFQNFRPTGGAKWSSADQSDPMAEDEGTINPFDKTKEDSYENDKVLLSISRINPVTNEVVETKEIRGTQHKAVLNRNAINPKNRTISSNVHAEIIVVEGKVFLKNYYPGKTTFLRVDDMIEVKKGSCILIGNELIRLD